MKRKIECSNMDFAERAVKMLDKVAKASIIKENDKVFLNYEIKGFDDEKSSSPSMEDLDNMMRMMFRELDFLWSFMMNEIDFVASRLQKHFEGHLPNMKSPKEMQRAVEILEVEENFDIPKQVLVARSDNNFRDVQMGDTLEVSIR